VGLGHDISVQTDETRYLSAGKQRHAYMVNATSGGESNAVDAVGDSSNSTDQAVDDSVKDSTSE
jgi:hypothetical protein